ncbi:hypothetical protein [Corallococcus coralloides]|uniref:hypothetical protein n=1 Tax=Corallococcus coralloides TaxID=184914 RepID=UPI0003076104|nr:hypothetical protein [Corallococcus coralloides]
MGSDTARTRFTLHQGLDAGYTLLFWNRLVLSLGVGVGYVVSTSGDMNSNHESNHDRTALGSRRPQLGFTSSYRVAAGIAF